MKLYEVPRDSYVKIIPQEVDNDTHQQGLTSEVKVPPAAPKVDTNEIIMFGHIDGMYSLCYKLDQDTLMPTEPCHIAAWTDVEVIELDELFTFERIREKIGRSGYGKDGMGEYRQAALKDMSDDWIKGAIDFVQPGHPHLKFYKKELEYRKEHGIFIPDEE